MDVLSRIVYYWQFETCDKHEKQSVEKISISKQAALRLLQGPKELSHHCSQELKCSTYPHSDWSKQE